MKNSLSLSWKRIRSQDSYVNKIENKALRIIYARQLLSILETNKVIINFDETIIRQTDNQKYSWDLKSGSHHRTVGKNICGLSILLAVTTLGTVYF